MKVFVLEEDYIDGSQILGVFASEKDAQAAAKVHAHHAGVKISGWLRVDNYHRSTGHGSLAYFYSDWEVQ